jgi:hypothetical protein
MSSWVVLVVRGCNCGSERLRSCQNAGVDREIMGFAVVLHYSGASTPTLMVRKVFGWLKVF